MPKDVIALLNTKKELIKAEQDKYNYALEEQEMKAYEVKLNETIRNRDAKKNLSDGLQNEIDKIDNVITSLTELIKIEEPATPVEEANNV